jgi:ABC-type transport system involved in multi-copper enzyme maturation permease subunit
MLLVGSVTSWCRRRLPWSNSRRAWGERLVCVSLLAGSFALWWYSSRLPLVAQVGLWAVLLVALAWTGRRGWLQLFGPVLLFDMIRTGRRGRHIFLRAAYAFLLLIVLFWVYSAWLLEGAESLSHFPARALAEFAASFFYVFMGLQLLAVFWLTPAYTAGAIALEKERRTLEFLLSTDLRSREIVLGLLVSRLANLALLLIAGLPVLSMLQFMGGVDPNLVLAGFAALGLTMVSLAALGTLNSLYARKPGYAILRTYLIALAYLVLSSLSWFLLLPALNLATFPSTDDWTSPITIEDLVEWLNIGNIGSAVMQLVHEVEKGGRLDLLLPQLLGKYAWFHGLITVGCCVWTMVRLRSQVLQSSKVFTEENLVRVRAKRSPWGLRRAVRTRLRDRAILWKDIFVNSRSGRRPLPSLIVGVILAAVFLPVVHICYFFGRVLVQGSGDGLGEMMNYWVRAASAFLGSILLLGVAVRAASCLSRERDQQTLEGLLTTPLDNRTILMEKWLGSLLGERRTWLILGLVWVLGYWIGGLHLLAIPCFLLAWLAYAMFLSGLGLWFSVANRSSHRAIFGTLLTTAWGLGILYLAAFDVPSSWLPNWFARNWQGMFMPPVTLGLLIFSPQSYQGWLSGEMKVMYFPLLLLAELALWYLGALGLFALANIRFRVVTGRTSGIADINPSARPPLPFPPEGEGKGGGAGLGVAPSDDKEEEEWEYIIPRSRRPKRIFSRVLLVLPLLLMLGWYGMRYLLDERELQLAIADADRLDPGWRLEELEAKRQVIPDVQNSALRIMEFKGWMPKGWMIDDTPATLGELGPQFQLHDRQVRAIANDLAKAKDALVKARRLANLPKGRFPIAWTPDGLSTLIDDVQLARNVANIVWYDAFLRAQEDDPDGALDSCRAMLNTGRAIGDEPRAISQLVHVAIQGLTLRTIERVLAQGQPGEPGLQNLQRLLEDEESLSLLLIAVRGERSLLDRLMESLHNGQTDPRKWGNIGGPGTEILLSGSLKDLRASFLELLNEIVEAAKLPDDKQAAEIKRIEISLPNRSMAVRQLAPAVLRVDGAFRRTKALLRCAIVALAVERYRIQHGRWPESLADLSPDLIAKIPMDPYIGKPLRYRRLADGVVIYSVGLDGKDDGGKIDRKNPNPSAPGTDIGIQLWDLDKRRQPPLPPKKTEDEIDLPNEEPKSP